MFAFVGDSTMTSGLPPDAASSAGRAPSCRRRSRRCSRFRSGWSSWARCSCRWCCGGAARGRRCALGCRSTGAGSSRDRGLALAPPTPAGRRRRPRNAPSAGHGKPRLRKGARGDPPWACRHRDQRRSCGRVPPACSPRVSRRPAPGDHLADRGQGRGRVVVVRVPHRTGRRQPGGPEPSPTCGRRTSGPRRSGRPARRRRRPPGPPGRGVLLHPGAAEQHDGVGGQRRLVGGLVHDDRAVAVRQDGGPRGRGPVAAGGRQPVERGGQPAAPPARPDRA